MGNVHHDPRIGAAFRAADEAGRDGLITRIGRRFGFGAAGPVAIAEPFAVEMPPERPPAGDAGLKALAAMLEELMSSAQSRIDGAALLVGRSAEETQVYREALISEVETLAGPIGDPVATALLDLTRAMIARTRGAEERLRSMGMELDALREDLAEARTSADRDQLTGLPNRRALEAALTRAIETTRAADRALSLAFCDIDHFKKLNDTHGHALGDRVLRLVGDCLTEGVGEQGFVGRQGGEEFVILFEGLPADGAAARVDAIRADLAGRDFKSRTNATPIGSITFSAGVAELREDETGDDLLGRADAALYRAKGNGRNRVEIDREE